MAELKFNIYYPHNLYFLMDNLSGWDIHCRSFFRKDFPDLFRLIKKFLPAYRKMRKKYGWEGKNLEQFFLEPDMKRAKRNLQKLPKRDRDLTLKIIDILDEEIGTYWVEREEILKTWTGILEGYWNRYSQKAVREIEQFLDLRLPEKINIFILFTPRGTGGSAAVGKRGITLEIGDMRKPVVVSFELLLHELIHFTEIVNNRDTEKELEKYGLERRGEFSEALLTKEAIVNLLCPYGFLSEELKIRKFMIFKYRWNEYQKRLFEYQKLLQKFVFDYFKNKKNQNYWNDFLPTVAGFITKKKKVIAIKNKLYKISSHFC